MSEIDPTIDETFREYTDLQLRRHYLILEGKDDSPETATAEHRMENLWADLDDMQRQSLRGMASDLNWIRREGKPPPKGRQTPDDVSAREMQDLAAAKKSKDWHRILHYLRLCALCFHAASLASERRTAYDAIGLPKYARVFAQAIDYGPTNLTAKVRHDIGGISSVIIEAHEVSRQQPKASSGAIHWSGHERRAVAKSQLSLGKLVAV